MRKALLAVSALLLLVVAGATPAPAAATQDGGLAPEGITVHIEIQTDGDARWTVSTSYLLNDSSDKRAFDDVAASFKRGQGDLGFSLRTFEAVLPRVEEGTGRMMSIEDSSWSSAVEADGNVSRGHLQLSFTWTNFTKVGNESLSLGGVFEGGWFGDLGPDQTLVISPPSGYDVSSAQPSHETVDGRLRWTGPIDFGPNEPLATFEVQQPGPEPPTGANIPWMTVAGALVTALVIGGIIAYTWFWRSERVEEPPPGPAADAAGETDGDQTESGAAADANPGPSGDDGGEAATADTETQTAEPTDDAAGAGEEPASEPEPELLSDEERVERLLEEHGGRMKQARIVEETRWSNAKVSQLLSQMADADRVEKLRIGRENLISLPDDEGEEGDGMQL